MNNQNARMVSRAIRNKLLTKLGNETISSKEVNLLIEEIGDIVVSLQTLYSAELLKLEKKFLNTLEEYKETLEEKSRNTTVNVNLNSQIDPESILKAIGNTKSHHFS